MLIKVTPHKVSIVNSEEVNEKEVNISKCQFEFEDIEDNLVKEAYFTLNGGTTYKQIIQNDECNFPSEVLNEKGELEIGVSVFKVEDEEYIKLYNPSPTYFNTLKGSLKQAENSVPVTPSDKEQMEQMLQDGLNDIEEAVEKAERLDIDATKTGNKATITITKQDGTQEEVEILDGISLLYNWAGTSLGIKREDEESYSYVDLKGEKGDAGAIKILIVQELPTEDIEENTIYLVPYEEAETGNIYKEYIYINNQWEELGSIPVEVDLSDYYTKTETNTLLSAKQPLIDNDHKLPYSLVSDTPDLTNYVKNTDYATASKGGVIKSGYYGLQVDSTNGKAYCDTYTYANYGNVENQRFISKGTLENVITGKDLTTKAYVDGLVGDIESVLEELDIGGGI